MLYSYNKDKKRIQTDAINVQSDRNFIAHYNIPATLAVVGDDDGIIADITPPQNPDPLVKTVSTGLLSIHYPRTVKLTLSANLTAAATMNAQLIGTDVAGNAITETLNFTDAILTLTTTKCFKSITSIVLTYSVYEPLTTLLDVGYTEELSLPFLLEFNKLLLVAHNNVIDTTYTLTTDATDVALNNIKMTNVLNGTKIDIYTIVGE